MTTYAYVRVSTSEQAEDGRSSLADQERRARGVSMMRGVKPEDVVLIADIGVSGSVPLADRAEGGRLYAGLESGDLVIAAKLDRLFRSAADALVTAEALQKRGVGIILADMGPDPVTENGISKLFFSMLAAFAEFERNRIAERMADGKRGKAARGGSTGGRAPYGWRIEGVGREAMLVEDEGEQATIRRAREIWGLAGGSLRRVGLTLAAEGRVSRGGRAFVAVQVQRMLGLTKDRKSD